MTNYHRYIPPLFLEYAAIVLVILAFLSLLNPVRWINAILSYVARGMGPL